LVGLRPEVHPKGIALALLTGILGFLGAFCYLMALRHGKVSVIVTMTALYPVISIGLAYAILHEPLSLKEGIGIVLAFIAIGLFTF
jgi:transporter family protein